MFQTINYKENPIKIVKTKNREIFLFDIADKNIDKKVVEDFGDEWVKFHQFEDSEISRIGDMYFDIIKEDMINENIYVLDIGCGTGRWTKYLAPRVGFIEAVDPSGAIFVADKLLEGIENVRLTQASIDTLPFPDATFDFAMSVGVLHHIPNTRKALNDCVKKLRKGGYFYVYLYYNLDNRGILFKFLFGIINLIRNVVSRFPGYVKRFVCDILAIVIYMPVILLGRLFEVTGFKKLAEKMPLRGYHNLSFYPIRNDALDRFGTRLEKRFSRDEIMKMMSDAGLSDIIVSDEMPYYHAIGKKL